MKSKVKVAIIILTISIIIASFFTISSLDTTNTIIPSTANVIWQKTFGNPGDNRAFYALPNSRGFLLIGSTESILENITSGWVIQTDSEGNVLWNKTYLQGFGTELRYAINLTDGYLLVGNEFSKDNQINGLVIKVNNNGVVLWNSTINERNVDKLFSGFSVIDGFILTGLTSSNGTNANGLVVKLDLNGQVLWSKGYLIGEDSAFRQGILAPDGNYIVAGYAKDNDYHFLLVKIDQTGTLMWNYTYGQENSHKAYAITEAKDGYVIVGDSVTQQSDSNAWAIKIDWNGNKIWDKSIGGNQADSAAFVCPSIDGNYLVGGFTFSFGKGNRDVWLFKISDEGKVLWSCTCGDQEYQEAYQVLESGKNQYVIIGWTDPPNQPSLIGKAQYDFYIAKISP